jgi:hypothetical protein
VIYGRIYRVGQKKDPLNFCVYLSNHLTKLPEILTANTLIDQKCCVKKSA